MIRLIDTALLDELSAEAKQSPRGRKNRNFHANDAQPGHRLLNAIEPGSYIMPHRHLDPNKDETMVVLRGSLGLVTFDDEGAVIDALKVSPAASNQSGYASDEADLRRRVVSHGGTPMGMDIPHGTWHTVFALEPGTVFLEAKAGPYLPLTVDEKAPWAPAEGSPGVEAFLAALLARVAES
jgi:cupin fold WbuC family metalloprotein